MKHLGFQTSVSLVALGIGVHDHRMGGLSMFYIYCYRYIDFCWIQLTISLTPLLSWASYNYRQYCSYIRPSLHSIRRQTHSVDVIALNWIWNRTPRVIMRFPMLNLALKLGLKKNRTLLYKIQHLIGINLTPSHDSQTRTYRKTASKRSTFDTTVWKQVNFDSSWMHIKMSASIWCLTYII